MVWLIGEMEEWVIECVCACVIYFKKKEREEKKEVDEKIVKK